MTYVDCALRAAAALELADEVVRSDVQERLYAKATAWATLGLLLKECPAGTVEFD